MCTFKGTPSIWTYCFIACQNFNKYFCCWYFYHGFASLQPLQPPRLATQTGDEKMKFYGPSTNMVTFGAETWMKALHWCSTQAAYNGIWQGWALQHTNSRPESDMYVLPSTQSSLNGSILLILFVSKLYLTQNLLMKTLLNSKTLKHNFRYQSL